MKAAELRAMSDEQLSLTLKDTIKNLFHLRIQSSTERLETPSEIKKARRDVARLKTLLHQRQLEAAKKASTGADKK
jgi:large subunit ribosomal protein L29